MGEIERSAGSADAELEIVKESVEYKINALRETWIGFFQELLTRQDIGELIDSATEASENFKDVIDSLVPIVKELLDLIGGLAKGIGKIADVTGKATVPLLALLGIGTKAIKNKGEQGIIGKIINSGSTNKISEEVSDLVDTLKDESKEIKVVDEANKGLAKSTNISTLAINGLRKAIMALQTPTGLLVASLTVVAVGLAVAWDKATVTVKEAQEEVDKTSDRVSNLRSEIEKLESIDYRNVSQQNRLEDLKQELSIQEKLLDVQKKRLALETYDSKFSDSFDSDNAYTQFSKEKTRRGHKNAYGYDTYLVSETVDPLNSAYEKTVKLQDEINKGMYTGNQLAKKSEELDKQKIEVSERLLDAYEEMYGYQDALNKAQEAIDSGDLELGSQAYKNAQEMIATYKEWIAEDKQAIDAIEKALGTFDYTSTIDSAFEHAEFQKAKEELVELGKKGELTVDAIAEKISNMYPLLLAAGMDAENLADEVYAYIMNLADPEAYERSQLGNEIAGKLGKKSYDTKGFEIGQVARGEKIQKFLDELYKNDPEKYKIAAGIDVDLSTFDENDVLEWMQNAINNSSESPLEVPIELNQTKFSEQVNELDALQSAYEKFRSNVENKEFKINLDISDVDALREKFGEIDGFDFDEFERTLTSDVSSIEQIQQAFDKAATAYANHKIELEGINAENKEMIRTQIEMEGITSETAKNFTDVQYVLLNMAEAEKTVVDSGIDLINITDEEIAKLVAEGEVAPFTAQALAVLALQKQLAAGITFGEQGNIDQIMALAQAAGVGAEYLTMLARAKAMAAQVDSGNYGRVAELEALQTQIQNYDWKKDLNLELKVDPSSVASSKRDAGSAGKETGDAYVEAYEAELKKLEDAKNQGLITEKQYLDRMRALYEKYFRGLSQYQDKYNEEQQKYLQGMLSLYNSAISAVGSIIDRKIKGLNKERDAIIKGYEDQKDAIQKVIDAKQEQIDGIQDEIDAIQKEIDAINEANEARQRQLTLQQDLYNMERLMAQRTRLVEYVPETIVI